MEEGKDTIRSAWGHAQVVQSREVKIQREMQSYAIKGTSRKGESYRGNALDSAYVPYATKSLADLQATAMFVLGRLQAAQPRLK